MSKQSNLFAGRRICWFSCGAASAVAAKLTLEKHPDAEIVYCDTSRNEHPDNTRFLADVEQWLGVKCKIIQSDKYSTIEEVFAATRYMSGIAGARCTTELKKIPRFAYQNPEDIHIFGLTADEGKRIKQFEDNNHDLNLGWPLRDAGITKANTLMLIAAAGIRLPAMYELGYANNNCLGCVKSQSPAYWNKIRVDFPKAFESRATQSRELGVRLVRYKGERIFLDELPANETEVVVEDLSCGPQCVVNE